MSSAMFQLAVSMVCLFATGHAHNQEEALAKLLLRLNPDSAFNPSAARSHLPASSRQTRAPQHSLVMSPQQVVEMMTDVYEKELPGFKDYMQNGVAKEVALAEDFVDTSLYEQDLKTLTVAKAAENSGMSESTVEKLMKLISPEAEQKIGKQIEEKVKALDAEVGEMLKEVEGMDEDSAEFEKKFKAIGKKVHEGMAGVAKIEGAAQKPILDLLEPTVEAARKAYKGPPIKIVPRTLEIQREDPDEAMKQFELDDIVFDNMPAEAAKILDAYDGDKPKETLAEFLKLFDPFEQKK